MRVKYNNQVVAVIYPGMNPPAVRLDKMVFLVSRQGTRGLLYDGGVAHKVSDSDYEITIALPGLVNEDAVRLFVKENGELQVVENFAGNQVREWNNDGTFDAWPPTPPLRF